MLYKLRYVTNSNTKFLHFPSCKRSPFPVISLCVYTFALLIEPWLVFLNLGDFRTNYLKIGFLILITGVKVKCWILRLKIYTYPLNISFNSCAQHINDSLFFTNQNCSYDFRKKEIDFENNFLKSCDIFMIFMNLLRKSSWFINYFDYLTYCIK